MFETVVISVFVFQDEHVLRLAFQLVRLAATCVLGQRLVLRNILLGLWNSNE